MRCRKKTDNFTVRKVLAYRVFKGLNICIIYIYGYRNFMINLIKELYKKNLIWNVLMIVVFSLSIYMTNMSLYSLYSAKKIDNCVEEIPQYSYYLTSTDHKGLTPEKLESLSEKYNFSYSNIAIDITANLDGVEVTEYIVNEVMSSFKFKLCEGKWFSKNSISNNECIIGGGLSDNYKIGDKVECNGKELTIIGILDEPFVIYLDYSGENVSYYDLIRTYNNLCITAEDIDSENSLARLIISDSPLNEEEFLKNGLILENFDEIKINTKQELKKSVVSTSFFVVFIIATMIVSCCILIYSTAYFNRDTLEIFRTCGASKVQLTFALAGQTLITMLLCMLIVLLLLGLIGNNLFFKDLFGTNYLLHFGWIVMYFAIVLCAEIIYILKVVLKRGICFYD